MKNVNLWKNVKKIIKGTNVCIRTLILYYTFKDEPMIIIIILNTV